MRCYYRNDISGGANRREFEDQSVTKGKIKIKLDKTKLVSHLEGMEGLLREKRREKKKRKKKKEKRISGMDYYGFVWICMDCYGFV